MTKRNRPPCDSGRLEEAINSVDPNNIEQVESFDKQDRDHFLSSSWSVEEELIRAIGVPLDKNKGRNAARNFILTEAMIAHEIGRSVSYSRRTNFYSDLKGYYSPDYTYANVRHVVGELLALGLIEELRARPGDHMRTEMQSRYWATPELVARWDEATRANFHLHGPLRLKDTEGNLIPFNLTDERRRMLKDLRVVNEFLASLKLDLNAPDAETIGHHVLLDDTYLLPTTLEMYRVFNAGSFDLGGRGYWWGQSMPKRRRPALLLNGEPTLEPDFSAYHVTMLYHELGLTPPAEPYDLGEPFTRDEGKLAVNVALNRGGGKGGVVASLLFKRFKLDRHTREPQWTRGRDGTHALVDALWKKHALIERQLGMGLGLHLMSRDSRIAFRMLKRCAAIGIPVLSWHDSFRFQERHVSKGAEIMEEAYAHEFKGSKPCAIKVPGRNVSQMPSSLPASSPSSPLSLERAALSGDFAQALQALDDAAKEPSQKSALSRKPVQLDFLAGMGLDEPERAIAEAVAASEAYEGGIIPEPIARAVEEILHMTGERHEDIAREIGTSRSHIVNWKQGRYGLSKGPARRLRRWIKDRAKAA